MLTRLDIYILRSNLGVFFGLLALALSILLMERLIRLADILSGTDNVIMTTARLVSNLLPHYLDIALPGAMLIAIIISVNRFSRTGEITTLLATGMSLWRIARPYMLFGGGLALISILLSGYLQPLSRYNYRQIVFELRQQSIVTAFQELKFVQFKSQTIWSDSVDRQGNILGETFIIEKRPDGSQRFLFGRSGNLTPDKEGGWVINLNDAMLGEVPQTYENVSGNHLNARNVDWQMPHDRGLFRTRGKDERELTLAELITKSYANSRYEINSSIAEVALHDRISRAVLLLVLPFIGVVLGLNLRRNPRSGGIVIGILLLLLIQKMFEFAQTKTKAGDFPAWLGFWPLLGLIVILSTYLFWRVGRGRPIWNGLPRRAYDKNDATTHTKTDEAT